MEIALSMDLTSSSSWSASNTVSAPCYCQIKLNLEDQLVLRFQAILKRVTFCVRMFRRDCVLPSSALQANAIILIRRILTVIIIEL
jgi:hypothetical protein